MLKCHEILPAGSYALDSVADTVVIDLEDRRRRRTALAAENGLHFILDLPEVPTIRNGDGMKLTDGRIVFVVAAKEHLAEISADNSAHLVRIAWHLGNRHLPTQLLGERLRIRADHVIEQMVRGLGGQVTPVLDAFDPESGAYGVGPVHDHHH